MTYFTKSHIPLNVNKFKLTNSVYKEIFNILIKNTFFTDVFLIVEKNGYIVKKQKLNNNDDGSIKDPHIQLDEDEDEGEGEGEEEEEEEKEEEEEEKEEEEEEEKEEEEEEEKEEFGVEEVVDEEVSTEEVSEEEEREEEFGEEEFGEEEVIDDTSGSSSMDFDKIGFKLGKNENIKSELERILADIVEKNRKFHTDKINFSFYFKFEKKDYNSLYSKKFQFELINVDEFKVEKYTYTNQIKVVKQKTKRYFYVKKLSKNKKYYYYKNDQVVSTVGHLKKIFNLGLKFFVDKIKRIGTFESLLESYNSLHIDLNFGESAYIDVLSYVFDNPNFYKDNKIGELKNTEFKGEKFGVMFPDEEGYRIYFFFIYVLNKFELYNFPSNEEFREVGLENQNNIEVEFDIESNISSHHILIIDGKFLNNNQEGILFTEKNRFNVLNFYSYYKTPKKIHDDGIDYVTNYNLDYMFEYSSDDHVVYVEKKENIYDKLEDNYFSFKSNTNNYLIYSMINVSMTKVLFVWSKKLHDKFRVHQLDEIDKILVVKKKKNFNIIIDVMEEKTLFFDKYLNNIDKKNYIYKSTIFLVSQEIKKITSDEFEVKLASYDLQQSYVYLTEDLPSSGIVIKIEKELTKICQNCNNRFNYYQNKHGSCNYHPMHGEDIIKPFISNYEKLLKKTKKKNISYLKILIEKEKTKLLEERSIYFNNNNDYTHKTHDYKFQKIVSIRTKLEHLEKITGLIKKKFDDNDLIQKHKQYIHSILEYTSPLYPKKSLNHLNSKNLNDYPEELVDSLKHDLIRNQGKNPNLNFGIFLLECEEYHACCGKKIGEAGCFTSKHNYLNRSPISLDLFNIDRTKLKIDFGTVMEFDGNTSIKVQEEIIQNLDNYFGTNVTGNIGPSSSVLMEHTSDPSRYMLGLYSTGAVSKIGLDNRIKSTLKIHNQIVKQYNKSLSLNPNLYWIIRDKHYSDEKKIYKKELEKENNILIKYPKFFELSYMLAFTYEKNKKYEQILESPIDAIIFRSEPQPQPQPQPQKERKKKERKKEEKKKKEKEKEKKILRLNFLHKIFMLSKSNYNDLQKSNKKLFSGILDKIVNTLDRPVKFRLGQSDEIFSLFKDMVKFIPTGEMKGVSIRPDDPSEFVLKEIINFKYPEDESHYKHIVNSKKNSKGFFKRMEIDIKVFVDGDIFKFIDNEGISSHKFIHNFFENYWDIGDNTDFKEFMQLTHWYYDKLDLKFNVIKHGKKTWHKQFGKHLLTINDTYPIEMYLSKTMALIKFFAFFNLINTPIYKITNVIFKKIFKEKPPSILFKLVGKYNEYFNAENPFRFIGDNEDFFEIDENGTLLLKYLPERNVKLGDQFLSWDNLVYFFGLKIFTFSDEYFNFSSTFYGMFKSFLRTYVLYDTFFLSNKYELLKKNLSPTKTTIEELIMKI